MRAVNVIGEQAAMLIGGVAADLRCAKCRDFDDFSADMHVNETKPPANDERAFAKAIMVLMDDPSLRKRKGDAGRKRVEEQLQWSVVSENLLFAYKSLLKV